MTATITVDGTTFVNEQDEVIIYPGAGRIKARFLSIKDKTIEIAKKVFSVVKDVARKIHLAAITKFFLKALVLVGYWGLCFCAGYLLGTLLVLFLTATSVGMAILWFVAFLLWLQVVIGLVLLPLRLQS